MIALQQIDGSRVLIGKQQRVSAGEPGWDRDLLLIKKVVWSFFKRITRFVMLSLKLTLVRSTGGHSFEFLNMINRL